MQEKIKDLEKQLYELNLKTHSLEKELTFLKANPWKTSWQLKYMQKLAEVMKSYDAESFNTVEERNEIVDWFAITFYTGDK